MEFAVFMGENKRKIRGDRQISGTCQRAETTVDHEDDGNIRCSWCPRNSS